MKKQSHSDPPLIHILTSPAAQNLCANGILSSGGKPLLSRNKREISHIKAQALLLNMGMWHWNDSSLFSAACAHALKRGIPVVLDPVGAGFSPQRRKFAGKLIHKYPKSIFLKANPSEMIAIANDRLQCRGVDSTEGTDTALSAALYLERFLSGWLISGKTDHTGSDGQMISIRGGHPMMGEICGTGCLLGAVTALKLSRSTDTIEGASQASRACKEAGEYAAPLSEGPGTFQSQFLDGLYRSAKENL